MVRTCCLVVLHLWLVLSALLSSLRLRLVFVVFFMSDTLLGVSFFALLGLKKKNMIQIFLFGDLPHRAVSKNKQRFSLYFFFPPASNRGSVLPPPLFSWCFRCKVRVKYRAQHGTGGVMIFAFRLVRMKHYYTFSFTMYSRYRCNFSFFLPLSVPGVVLYRFCRMSYTHDGAPVWGWNAIIVRTYIRTTWYLHDGQMTRKYDSSSSSTDRGGGGVQPNAVSA